jgi:hypothetical protein
MTSNTLYIKGKSILDAATTFHFLAEHILHFISIFLLLLLLLLLLLPTTYYYTTLILMPVVHCHRHCCCRPCCPCRHCHSRCHRRRSHRRFPCRSHCRRCCPGHRLRSRSCRCLHHPPPWSRPTPRALLARWIRRRPSPVLITPSSHPSNQTTTRGGLVVGTPRPRRRTAHLRTLSRQSPPTEELGGGASAFHPSSCACLCCPCCRPLWFYSWRNENEKISKRVVYLKRPRDDPSAPPVQRTVARTSIVT